MVGFLSGSFAWPEPCAVRLIRVNSFVGVRGRQGVLRFVRIYARFVGGMELSELNLNQFEDEDQVVSADVNRIGYLGGQ